MANLSNSNNIIANSIELISDDGKSLIDIRDLINESGSQVDLSNYYLKSESDNLLLNNKNNENITFTTHLNLINTKIDTNIINNTVNSLITNEGITFNSFFNTINSKLGITSANISMSSIISNEGITFNSFFNTINSKISIADGEATMLSIMNNVDTKNPIITPEAPIAWTLNLENPEALTLGIIDFVSKTETEATINSVITNENISMTTLLNKFPNYYLKSETDNLLLNNKNFENITFTSHLNLINNRVTISDCEFTINSVITNENISMTTLLNKFPNYYLKSETDNLLLNNKNNENITFTSHLNLINNRVTITDCEATINSVITNENISMTTLLDKFPNYYLKSETDNLLLNNKNFENITFTSHLNLINNRVTISDCEFTINSVITNENISMTTLLNKFPNYYLKSETDNQFTTFYNNTVLSSINRYVFTDDISVPNNYVWQYDSAKPLQVRVKNGPSSWVGCTEWDTNGNLSMLNSKTITAANLYDKTTIDTLLNNKISVLDGSATFLTMFNKFSNYDTTTTTTTKFNNFYNNTVLSSINKYVFTDTANTPNNVVHTYDSSKTLQFRVKTGVSSYVIVSEYDSSGNLTMSNSNINGVGTLTAANINATTSLQQNGVAMQQKPFCAGRVSSAATKWLTCGLVDFTPTVVSAGVFRITFTTAWSGSYYGILTNTFGNNRITVSYQSPTYFEVSIYNSSNVLTSTEFTFFTISN